MTGSPRCLRTPRARSNYAPARTNAAAARRRACSPATLEAVERFTRQWNKPGYGVYFGCATRSGPPGTIANTLELPGVWVDNDATAKAELLGPAGLLPPAISDRRQRPRPAPLLAVRRAGRRIAQPTTNDHPGLTCCGRCAASSAAILPVCDLARIMRLPGTRQYEVRRAAAVPGDPRIGPALFPHRPAGMGDLAAAADR